MTCYDCRNYFECQGFNAETMPRECAGFAPDDWIIEKTLKFVNNHPKTAGKTRLIDLDKLLAYPLQGDNLDRKHMPEGFEDGVKSALEWAEQLWAGAVSAELVAEIGKTKSKNTNAPKTYLQRLVESAKACCGDVETDDPCSTCINPRERRGNEIRSCRSWLIRDLYTELMPLVWDENKEESK